MPALPDPNDLLLRLNKNYFTSLFVHSGIEHIFKYMDSYDDKHPDCLGFESDTSMLKDSS